ncbi:MAG: hypothetical protein H6652_05990 [Ardenticatenaceae bacterium]|nr:hypothetical protein [Ardenticatenaceae bacterium]MCB8946732.1 hypothetical protein [Ardenticatenaceae bacterium]
MGEKLTKPANRDSQKHQILFIAALIALLLFVVACQEEQADDEQVAVTETVSTDTAATGSEADETAVPTIGSAETTPEMTADSLPDGLNLVGEVQAVDGDEIAVDVPADAEANLLDLYGWDGTRWVFLPSTFAAATGQRHAPNQSSITAVALVQADAPDAPTIGGVWSEDMADFTLSAPEDASGLDEALIALGESADTVYLQLPLDPQAYKDGTIEQIITWATDNIDRRKLVAVIPSGPVMQSGDSWVALSAEDLAAQFGALEFVDDAEPILPETAVEVAFSGDVSEIEWDEDAAAYRYTVDEETVWLVGVETLMGWVETAVSHNLQGVAFTTAVQLDADQNSDPTIVWTILDDEENAVASESGGETAFSWAGTADPGEFTLQAEFVSGSETVALGTLPITVAAADEAEVVAEGDEDTETVTGILKVNAFVRIGPGEGYDKFPGVLLRDSELEILGRDEFGYWFYIPFENSDGEQTGWIAASLVELDPSVEVSALADMSETIVEAPATTVAAAPAPAPAPADDPVAGEVPSAPPAGPPPPVSAPPVAVGGFELGGQTHSFSAPHLMAASGMTWVKFQHKWGEGGNPNDLAGRINDAHALGFKVLLSIPGANTYPESINFGAYVEFLAGVAALGPDAIEVWNEMNIDFEWPAGQIDPASYVNNMLAPAYNAIKAANPNVMVISGAPAPTGFDNGTNAWADNRYMAGMLAAGGASYADCIGAHYNAGASSPSTVSGHPTGSAHYSWYLLPTLNVYAQLGRPVCFTELGYLSGQDYGGVPERFGWAANTTVDQHAAWLAEAVSVAANTGKVRLIIVFNVDFTQWGDDPQAGYAMIRKNGGCPACDTLARVMGR